MPQSGSASQMLSTQAPVAAQSVLSSPCSSLLCHSEHSSTQPSLTLGLRLSSSGRILIFCVMWLQTVCWFPSPWPSWLSGEAVDLLLNAEHTKKQWGTRWLKKCNWWSQQPFLEESLGHLTGSLSLHGFVLGKNKRVLCDLTYKALG